MRNILLAFMYGLILAVGPAHATQRKADEANNFEAAIALYKQGEWAGAYGRFASLADRGNQDAARIALFMVRHGPQLYKSAWSATQFQLQRWTKLSSSKGDHFVADGGD